MDTIVHDLGPALGEASNKICARADDLHGTVDHREGCRQRSPSTMWKVVVPLGLVTLAVVAILLWRWPR